LRALGNVKVLMMQDLFVDDSVIIAY